jgi:hypothetical protein
LSHEIARCIKYQAPHSSGGCRVAAAISAMELHCATVAVIRARVMMGQEGSSIFES